MEFKLPDIGEGIHEAEIVRWLVHEGDQVKEDQPIVEVMTDKATVEITSPATGAIGKIRVPEGKSVEVGTVLVDIQEGGAGKPAEGKQEVATSHITPGPAPEKTVAQQEAAPTAQKGSAAGAEAPARGVQESFARTGPATQPPAPPRAGQVPQERPAPAAGPAPNGIGQGKVLATPATRKMARELGVPLASVIGSGPSGRVTKDDVRRTASGPPAEGKPQEAAAAAPAPAAAGSEERVPLRGIRRRIAQHMVEAKQHVPHFTYVEEVDMTALVALRQVAKPLAEQRGIKLSYLPFIIKAMIAALREFPTLNASLDEEKQEVVLKRYYNMGIATAAPDGLIVPVVKNCEAKTIFQIAREIVELAEKARNNKLAISDLQGGTISITNIGSIGGVAVMPIVNWPEVAILGVNKIRQQPVVRDGQVVIRDMMYLSIACDHRVVDGAVAAEFMKRMIQFLEQPQLLLLDS